MLLNFLCAGDRIADEYRFVASRDLIAPTPRFDFIGNTTNRYNNRRL